MGNRLLLVGRAGLWLLVFTGLVRAEGKGLDVLVSADAISPEGFRPTPGKPVHFVFTQTRQSLGDSIAGVKLPPPELVERAAVAELTRQGFC